jgi:hypothetical protein
MGAITSRIVWAKLTFEGWHSWPDAPEHRFYLRSSHRHLFHVTVEVPVTHDNRQIEFHDLLDKAKVAVADLPRSLGSMSCEQIAVHIGERVRETMVVPWVNVVVSEDGEVGASVTVEPLLGRD